MLRGEIVLHTERICEVVDVIDAKSVMLKTLFSASCRPVQKDSVRAVRVDAVETRDRAVVRLRARRDRCDEILSLLEARSPFVPSFTRPRHGELSSRIDFSLSPSWRAVTYPHGTTHHYLFYAKFVDVVAVEVTEYDACVNWCFFLPFVPDAPVPDSGNVFVTKTKSPADALREAKKVSVERLLKHLSKDTK
jgi:hypothetical protein